MAWKSFSALGMGRNTTVYDTSGAKALTPGEAEKTLDACHELEHEALLALAMTTGMRRADVVRVEWANVDFDRRWVRFREKKKGDEPHEVPLGGRALKCLRQLATSRDPVGKLECRATYVFPSPWGDKGHLSGRTAWNWLQRALERAGLEERPFHSLRATAVKLADKRGWPIQKAAALLNDTEETVLQHYRTPTPEEMVQTAEENPIL